jgi:hypothetical protein
MELLSTIKCNYIEFHTLLCYSQSIVFNVSIPVNLIHSVKLNHRKDNRYTIVICTHDSISITIGVYETFERAQLRLTKIYEQLGW